MSKNAALNQILAISKGVSARRTKEITDLHRQTQSANLFNGIERTYTKTAEGSPEFSPEKLPVQLRYDEALRTAISAWGEIWNLEAARDTGNTLASSDIVVGTEIIAKDVPATYLLTLEKALANVQTFLSKMVELDSAQEWTKDENSGNFFASPTRVHKTQKKASVITLAEATDKHPAQAQLVNTDEVIGYWEEKKSSGAIPVVEKRRLLSKLYDLQKAVKQAREAANMTPVPKKETGTAVLAYLFS